MQDTIIRYLAGVGSERDRANLLAILTPIADRISSRMLDNAALAISTTKTLAKVTEVCHASVQGVLRELADDTDMAALSGTVAAAAFNVYCFFIDKAGTLTSAMGTAGATLAAVKFPPFPQGKALIGFVIINPTGTGDFVGGTTELDDGTVVPNAVFVSVQGAFDPTVLLS